MSHDKRQCLPKVIPLWHIISEFPVIIKCSPKVRVAFFPMLILLPRPIFTFPLTTNVPETSHIVLEYNKS